MRTMTTQKKYRAAQTQVCSVVGLAVCSAARRRPYYPAACAEKALLHCKPSLRERDQDRDSAEDDDEDTRTEPAAAETHQSWILDAALLRWVPWV